MTSSVQLENGYTRIANEILEALASTDLNGTQRRIIDVVLRQTYGYQRKDHEISITFIANATNIHKKQIQRELNVLIERKIIDVVVEATFNKSRVLSLNKNYKGWLNSSEVTNKLPPNKKDTHTGSELVTATGSELAPQIKKKENNKEIYISIVDYLNIKANKNYKATTKKTQSLIDGRLKEGFTLDDFKKVIDNKIATWKGTEWEKYLRPETLFGNKFEGYLNEKNSIKETEESLQGSNWRGSDKRL